MIVKCPICAEPLRPEQYNSDSLCTGCSAPLHSAAYPALVRDREVVHSEQLRDEDQASCFYHPEKQAVVDCGYCGRFLCALCDLEVTGHHLCPVCLSQGRDQHGVTRQNDGYIRFDMVAFALAFWPLVIFLPLAIFGAPLALYITIKYYRTPISITPVGRWRFPVAAFLAAVQLIGFGVLAYILLL